jgi:hypothetical protein
MLLVEGTLWPLVVVGALSDSSSVDVVMTVDEHRLWSSDALKLALVVPGCGRSARERQGELFKWLLRYRRNLCLRAARVAFVIEDDTLRTCAETWLEFASGRLCHGEVHTFRTLKPALSWLTIG